MDEGSYWEGMAGYEMDMAEMQKIIDALVGALEAAMPYLRGYAVAKRADAALALARGGK